MKSNVVRFLSNCIFPPVCYGCGAIGVCMCSNCLGEVHKPERICLVCGKKIPISEQACCKSKKYGEALVLWKYNKRISNIIKTSKYENMPQALTTLLGYMSPEQLAQLVLFVKSKLNPAFLPVPLHPVKLRERGFNQSQVISEALAAIFGVGVLKRGIVTRVRNTPQQATRRSKESRQENVAGSFYVSNAELLFGKDIFIIDDVLTTGSTVKSLIDEIYLHTGQKTHAVALAHET